MKKFYSKVKRNIKAISDAPLAFFYVEDKSTDKGLQRVFFVEKKASIKPQQYGTVGKINKLITREGVDACSKRARVCAGRVSMEDGSFVFRIAVKKGIGPSQLLRGLKFISKAEKLGMMKIDVLKVDSESGEERTTREVKPYYDESELKDRLLAYFRTLESQDEIPEAELDKLIRRLDKVDEEVEDALDDPDLADVRKRIEEELARQEEQEELEDVLEGLDGMKLSGDDKDVLAAFLKHVMVNGRRLIKTLYDSILQTKRAVLADVRKKLPPELREQDEYAPPTELPSNTLEAFITESLEREAQVFIKSNGVDVIRQDAPAYRQFYQLLRGSKISPQVLKPLLQLLDEMLVDPYREMVEQASVENQFAEVLDFDKLKKISHGSGTDNIFKTDTFGHVMKELKKAQKKNPPDYSVMEKYRKQWMQEQSSKEKPLTSDMMDRMGAMLDVGFAMQNQDKESGVLNLVDLEIWMRSLAKKVGRRKKETRTEWVKRLSSNGKAKVQRYFDWLDKSQTMLSYVEKHPNWPATKEAEPRKDSLLQGWKKQLENLSIALAKASSAKNLAGNMDLRVIDQAISRMEGEVAFAIKLSEDTTTPIDRLRSMTELPNELKVEVKDLRDILRFRGEDILKDKTPRLDAIDQSATALERALTKTIMLNSAQRIGAYDVSEGGKALLDQIQAFDHMMVQYAEPGSTEHLQAQLRLLREKEVDYSRMTQKAQKRAAKEREKEITSLLKKIQKNQRAEAKQFKTQISETKNKIKQLKKHLKTAKSSSSVTPASQVGRMEQQLALYYEEINNYKVEIEKLSIQNNPYDDGMMAASKEMDSELYREFSEAWDENTQTWDMEKLKHEPSEVKQIFRTEMLLNMQKEQYEKMKETLPPEVRSSFDQLAVSEDIIEKRKEKLTDMSDKLAKGKSMTRIFARLEQFKNEIKTNGVTAKAIKFAGKLQILLQSEMFAEVPVIQEFLPEIRNVATATVGDDPPIDLVDTLEDPANQAAFEDAYNEATSFSEEEINAAVREQNEWEKRTLEMLNRKRRKYRKMREKKKFRSRTYITRTATDESEKLKVQIQDMEKIIQRRREERHKKLQSSLKRQQETNDAEFAKLLNPQLDLTEKYDQQVTEVNAKEEAVSNRFTSLAELALQLDTIKALKAKAEDARTPEENQLVQQYDAMGLSEDKWAEITKKLNPAEYKILQDEQDKCRAAVKVAQVKTQELAAYVHPKPSAELLQLRKRESALRGRKETIEALIAALDEKLKDPTEAARKAQYQKQITENEKSLKLLAAQWQAENKLLCAKDQEERIAHGEAQSAKITEFVEAQQMLLTARIQLSRNEQALKQKQAVLVEIDPELATLQVAYSESEAELEEVTEQKLEIDSDVGKVTQIAEDANKRKIRQGKINGFRKKLKSTTLSMPAGTWDVVVKIAVPDMSFRIVVEGTAYAAKKGVKLHFQKAQNWKCFIEAKEESEWYNTGPSAVLLRENVYRLEALGIAIKATRTQGVAKEDEQDAGITVEREGLSAKIHHINELVAEWDGVGTIKELTQWIKATKGDEADSIIAELENSRSDILDHYADEMSLSPDAYVAEMAKNQSGKYEFIVEDEDGGLTREEYVQAEDGAWYRTDVWDQVGRYYEEKKQLDALKDEVAKLHESVALQNETIAALATAMETEEDPVELARLRDERRGEREKLAALQQELTPKAVKLDADKDTWEGSAETRRNLYAQCTEQTDIAQKTPIMRGEDKLSNEQRIAAHKERRRNQVYAETHDDLAYAMDALPMALKPPEIHEMTEAWEKYQQAFRDIDAQRKKQVKLNKDIEPLEVALKLMEEELGDTSDVEDMDKLKAFIGSKKSMGDAVKKTFQAMDLSDPQSLVASKVKLAAKVGGAGTIVVAGAVRYCSGTSLSQIKDLQWQDLFFRWEGTAEATFEKHFRGYDNDPTAVMNVASAAMSSLSALTEAIAMGKAIYKKVERQKKLNRYDEGGEDPLLYRLVDKKIQHATLQATNAGLDMAKDICALIPIVGACVGIVATFKDACIAIFESAKRTSEAVKVNKIKQSALEEGDYIADALQEGHRRATQQAVHASVDATLNLADAATKAVSVAAAGSDAGVGAALNGVVQGLKLVHKIEQTIEKHVDASRVQAIRKRALEGDMRAQEEIFRYAGTNAKGLIAIAAQDGNHLAKQYVFKVGGISERELRMASLEVVRLWLLDAAYQKMDDGAEDILDMKKYGKIAGYVASLGIWPLVNFIIGRCAHSDLYREIKKFEVTVKQRDSLADAARQINDDLEFIASNKEKLRNKALSQNKRNVLDARIATFERDYMKQIYVIVELHKKLGKSQKELHDNLKNLQKIQEINPKDKSECEQKLEEIITYRGIAIDQCAQIIAASSRLTS